MGQTKIQEQFQKLISLEYYQDITPNVINQVILKGEMRPPKCPCILPNLRKGLENKAV